MQTFVVEATPRTELGKNVNRRLRKGGRIPAVLYGGGEDAVSLALNAKQIAAILRSESGHNTIFTVQVPGRSDTQVMVKDWQTDPVKGDLLHADLFRVAMNVRIRVQVPVHTFGEPVGVKIEGGIFETVTREVEIECLPADIPGEFRVDVSEFHLHQQLRAADLPLEKDRFTLVTDPDRVIAHVVALRAEEEKPVEELAAEVAAVPAEPEVIKKGKKEEEEGEGEGEPEAKKEARKEEPKKK